MSNLTKEELYFIHQIIYTASVRKDSEEMKKTVLKKIEKMIEERGTKNE